MIANIAREKSGSGIRWVGRWDSVEAFADDAKRGVAARAAGSGHSSTKEARDESWDLGQGFDLVAQRALEGWPEMAERIRNTALPLAAKLTQQIEVDRYDFVDDGSIASDFDVPTALTGEPCAWLQHWSEVVEGKGARIVRIGAMFSNHCGISAEAMVRRGVVAAALAMCLDVAGMGVEITGFSCTQSSGEMFAGIVKVKRAGDMLELSRIAMALANPGMLRRLHFGIVEGDGRMTSSLRNHGYGMPVDAPMDMRADEKIDIFIDTNVVNMSDAEVIGYVMAELKRQGVTFRS